MKSLALRLFFLVVVAIAAAGAGTWWYATSPLQLARPVVDFTVARGFTMRDAAAAIAAAGVEVNPRVLYWIARATGKGDRILAGSYEVHEGVTPWRLILKLSSGDV